jgi:hypothetical protein
MFDRINKIDFDPLHDVLQRLAGGGRRSWQGPGPSIQSSPSPASRLPPAASPSSPRDLSHLKFMNTNEVPVFRDPTLHISETKILIICSWQLILLEEHILILKSPSGYSSWII